MGLVGLIGRRRTGKEGQSIMQGREIENQNGSAMAYHVSFTLGVADLGALWNAAAERALQAPGMTLADVLDTIGPREDPSIADCIAMLTAPVGLPGCAVDGFAVREVPAARGGSATAELIQLPVGTRNVPLLPAAAC